MRSTFLEMSSHNVFIFPFFDIIFFRLLFLFGNCREKENDHQHSFANNFQYHDEQTFRRVFHYLGK
jgi:hypothetical protein